MAIKTITCPDCRGEGYIGNGENGECTHCNGTGSITDGYVFSATAWLHVPSRGLWINPNGVARIYGKFTGYAIHFDDINIDVLTVDDPDDVEAVTAWLEA